jgi:hypothetical protein
VPKKVIERTIVNPILQCRVRHHIEWPSPLGPWDDRMWMAAGCPQYALWAFDCCASTSDSCAASCSVTRSLALCAFFTSPVGEASARCRFQFQFIPTFTSIPPTHPPPPVEARQFCAPPSLHSAGPFSIETVVVGALLCLFHCTKTSVEIQSEEATRSTTQGTHDPPCFVSR